MTAPAPAANDPGDVAVVFVSQEGEIEPKSLLLAASLRDELGAAVRLVAVVPSMYGASCEPAPASRALLDRLAVEIRRAKNPHCAAGATARVGDGHMNKALALAVDAGAARTVVVDSDVLCLGPPAAAWRGGAPFLAKPVDLVQPTPWPALYALFDRALPAETVASTVDGRTLPPYFNSGMIVADGTLAPRLATCWHDTFDRVTASGLLDHMPFFREQVSLALAVQRLGVAWTLLDEIHNWPAHLKPIDAARPPAFVHYHRVDVLAAAPLLHDRVRALVARHDGLGDALARHPGWDGLVG